MAKAVNEFCMANNCEIVFLALQFLGYHDIAIRKNTGEKEVRVQLQESQSELQKSQMQIEQLELELEQARRAIDFMENDKFWKLRSQWLKIKNLFA